MAGKLWMVLALSVGVGVAFEPPALGLQTSFGPTAMVSPTGMSGLPSRGAARATGGPVDPAQVASIASAIRNSIVAMPANALQADIEAGIVFSIDQVDPSLDVALAALGAVDRTGFSDAANSAVDAVLANRSRLASRGTGAIAGGGDVGLAFDTSYSVGGGSSDYSR